MSTSCVGYRCDELDVQAIDTHHVHHVQRMALSNLVTNTKVNPPINIIISSETNLELRTILQAFSEEDKVRVFLQLKTKFYSEA